MAATRFACPSCGAQVQLAGPVPAGALIRCSKCQATFALAPVYIGALALTALAVWQVTGDGEAAAFEGWALVALYVILATFTLYE